MIDLVLRKNTKKDPEEVEQPAKDLGITIKGLRWRLKVSKKSKTGTNLPLPSKGKVTVTHGKKKATTEYEIPDGGSSKVGTSEVQASARHTPTRCMTFLG